MKYSDEKILVVGSFNKNMVFHTAALKEGFSRIGCNVSEFNWDIYASKNKFLSKIEEHFLIGPKLKRCNDALYRICVEDEIEFVFIYRGTHIFLSTISKLRMHGVIVFEFNNDNPFGLLNNKFFWRHYIKNCNGCDLIYAFRDSDIAEYKTLGVTNCKILYPYYIKDRTFPIARSKVPSQYLCDVVFIGHFEDDGRDEYLYKLFKNHINVKIYGDDNWKKSKYYPYFLSKCQEIRPAVEDYNLALNGAKIGLSFLSKWNKDTHTRRSFEIPSAQIIMISEYTEVLGTIFKEDEQAVFFRSEDEFIKKVLYYLNNDMERERIALNGTERCRESFEVERIAEGIRDDFLRFKEHKNN